MELALRIADDPSGRELSSLRAWLLREPGLRGGMAKVTAGGVTGPGHMGAEGLELINVVLSNAIALGSLIVSIASWRASRPRRPPVHIETNGVSVVVHTNDPEDLRAIVEALTRTTTRSI